MTIEQFITTICEHCGVPANEMTVNQVDSEGIITVNITIPEEDSGRFIGFHGESLEALQRIARVVFAREYPETKIIININEYREERSEKLRELTQSIVERVIATGTPYTFQSYLPAHERFIIHSTLSEIEGSNAVESISEGDGKNRRLTIRKK